MRGATVDQKDLDALLICHPEDKLRLAMIRYLTCNAAKEEAEVCEKLLEGIENTNAFAYLKQLQMLLTMGVPNGAAVESAGSSAASWMREALSSATTLASNMMGTQWKTNATRIVEGVMEQYGTPEVEQMLYLDP